jgi:predicted aldo/keto reductase-like oxidoreductase
VDWQTTIIDKLTEMHEDITEVKVSMASVSTQMDNHQKVMNGDRPCVQMTTLQEKWVKRETDKLAEERKRNVTRWKIAIACIGTIAIPVIIFLASKWH